MASREPFSRKGARGDDGRSPDERLIGAYEFAAAEYGWSPAFLEEGLSDEQLVAYLDAASDRIGQHRKADFEASVEAVRVGTIFAHDQKAAARWRRSLARQDGHQVGLTGAALEGAVATLARSNPEYVVVGA